MISEVRQNNLVVEAPFDYRVNPVDYITLTEFLVKNPKLFSDINLIRSEIAEGQKLSNESMKRIKEYSRLLQRWSPGIEIDNFHELFKDFEIYRYFYKEIGASLKFNPLSQSSSGTHVLGKILLLLKQYVELILPKTVYTFVDVIADNEGIKIIDSNIRFNCKKLKLFTNHSSIKSEKEIAPKEIQGHDIVVYVVTIGDGIDKEIKYLTNEGEMFDAYLLNGIGAGAAEMVANDLNSFVNDNYGKEGYLYKRLSPGYGEWSVTEQSKIFQILHPEKNIKVTLTSSHIMLPEKSTSGIMGLTLMR